MLKKTTKDGFRNPNYDKWDRRGGVVILLLLIVIAISLIVAG